jgi:uncharacterized protein (TIGR02099 family)
LFTASSKNADATERINCIVPPSEHREESITEGKISAPGAASAVPVRSVAGRRVFSWFRNAVASVLIVVALLLGLLRFGFPALENHRPEVEQWVSGLLQRPVSIDSLRAYWRGWAPEVEISGLKLHRVKDVGASAEPAITFDKVRIKIDPVASLKDRRLLAHSVTIVGASLTVKRFEDGSIHVAGMQTADGAAPGRLPGNLARWVLKEGDLIFDATTVQWVDARHGNAPVLLTSTRVKLSNSGDNHRLSGTFRLPGISHERIQFALDASGDLSTSAWSGSTVVNANGIRAAQLKTLFSSFDRWVSGGKSDLSVWTRWRRGIMEGARARIRADGLILSDTLGGLRVHGGTAEVQIGRLDNGWSADLLLSDIHTSEGRWRDSRGTLNYLTDPENGRQRLVGRFEHARLADLTSVMQSRLKTIEFASAAVETYRPSADLSNLHFSVGLSPGVAEPFRLTAKFDNLSAFVGPNFPGLSGYSGEVEIDGGAGVVIMKAGTLDMALSGAFDGRFLVQTRGGRVAWRQQPGGLRLDVYDMDAAAEGIDARVSGFALFDGEPSGPLLNVVAELRSDDVGELRRYIPSGILKPKLTHWLRRAVRGGRLADGSLLLHGRVGEFPFDEENGVFEAQFAIEDGMLDYGRGWPELYDLKGKLSFKGRRMEATLGGGRILGAHIDQGSVTIDHIGQGVPVVEIRGSGNGTAAQGLEFLSRSPLNDRVSEHIRDIVAEGKVELNLAVDYPLNKSGIRVDGRVALEGNTVEFPHLRSGLQQVRGILRFNGQGARAQAVDALYLGQPVKVDLGRRPEAPRDTRVRISGSADGAFVARHLSNTGLLSGRALWLERLHGETEWLATIDIPAVKTGVERGPTVRLESSLEGLAVNLPYPVGKDGASARSFLVTMRAGDGKRKQVQMRYGDDAAAVVELEAQNASQTIRRGAVRLGGGNATLPDGEGVYVQGALSELPAGEWVHVWKTAFVPQGADPPPQSRLRQLDLDVDRLVLLGSGFDRVRIRAIQNENGSWNTRFDGPGLKGTVRLLEAAGERTFLATFEEVDYRSTPGEKSTRLSNPQDIPAIRLMSERFTYNNRDLGVVKLSASPTPAGLNFGDISIVAPDFEARANGYWHQKDGIHSSEFSISAHSKELGRFLQAMGFAGSNVSGGATDVFVNAKWPASPMEFDLRKLNGTLHFRSADGNLLGVKRGVPERIFGLLSVTALPQRLLMDFSDLFEQGVSYNLIEGSFNLERGEAYTNNLSMETDTARVEIAGRTGLISEDYDQIMTVTPKLTSSLPLAPLWLAEKAFNRELFGKTFSAQYTITGSWSDPKVEPIQTEREPEERG